MLMIHTADIHLGASPDVGEPWGKNRKQEIWDSFERLVDAVREEQADLLLIAGDLFHRPPLLRELREVDALFASLEGTHVVLMAGNHDYVGVNSFYKKMNWASNVHFLQAGTVSKVCFPEIKTEVYGFSYDKKEIREPLYDKIMPEENGYYHVLLAHGGDEKHIPFNKQKLEKNNFDYIAFGHIHKPGMILPGKAVMAGSLEPTDHTCSGSHGYVKVEVSEGSNQILFVPFARREYRTMELILTPEDTMASLVQRVGAQIKENGPEHIYEMILTGKRHAALEILEARLKALGNIREIIDCTEKAYDYQGLRKEYSGRLLQKYIDSFGNVESSLEKRALELGVEAILEALER